jgi:AcrR family transcriptional regulator
VQTRPRSAGRPFADPDRDARESLLSAATQLFAEHGVAATSFTRIARRAGLTPAMMHYYFDDRDQLIDAVVGERLIPLIADVWDPVKPEDDPVDMISGVVQRLLSNIERAPWVPSTWMREILNEGGLLRTKVLRRLPVDKVRLVGAAIRARQSAHAMNPEVDPLLAVFSALGLVMLHMATIRVWSEIFHRPPLSVDTMQRHITGLLLDGLRHSSRPSGKRTRGRQPPRRKS